MARTTEPYRQEELSGLRPLVSADAPMLGDLMYAAYHGTVDDEGESREDATAECQRTLAGHYGQVLWDCSFVIEADDRLLAATVVTAYDGEPVPLIAFNMTRPENQRQGLATSLMQKAIGALHERGEDRVCLHVTATNTPAISLYQKLGFQRQTEYRSGK